VGFVRRFVPRLSKSWVVKVWVFTRLEPGDPSVPDNPSIRGHVARWPHLVENRELALSFRYQALFKFKPGVFDSLTAEAPRGVIMNLFQIFAPTK